jgi:hypothetical protein
MSRRCASDRHGVGSAWTGLGLETRRGPSRAYTLSSGGGWRLSGMTVDSVSREGHVELKTAGGQAHLDILLLLRVHPHSGRILSGLVALAGIDVVRVGLNGSLTLIHGGLLGVDRQVGRVGERHVTIGLCMARWRRCSCRGSVAKERQQMGEVKVVEVGERGRSELNVVAQPQGLAACGCACLRRTLKCFLDSRHFSTTDFLSPIDSEIVDLNRRTSQEMRA